MALFNKHLIIFSLTISMSSVVIAKTGYPLLEKLVGQKQYAKAYQRAVILREENEGDPRFDYLYGFSALQAGHYNEAVFALDRVTVSTPHVIRPRLELARAYLRLNNNTAAIKEFNDVLSLSPPPIVRKNVMAYIAELEKHKNNRVVQRSVTRKLVSFLVGYDDNVNFGHDGEEIELPDFGLLILDPLSVKQGSGFAEAKLQIKHRTIKNKHKITFVLANLTHKKYFKSNHFDLLDLDFRVGMTLNKDDFQYQFIGRTRPIMLDGDMYSNTLGIDAVARKSLSGSSIGSVQLSLEKYDNRILSLSDRSRAVVSGRWEKHIGETDHQISMYLGKEWPDKKEGKQYSRDIAGLGYFAVREWNNKNRSYIGLDYRHYKHQKAYPVFPDKRSDDRFILKAGHQWQINDKLALIFAAQHVNNKSNIDLYDAKRNEVKVGIRYDWD